MCLSNMCNSDLELFDRFREYGVAEEGDWYFE